MPNYRRPWVPGATYFITITTYRRRHLFTNDESVELWRQALTQARREKPFAVTAGVVLHDHLHLMVELPRKDADLSSRIGRAKALFTRALGAGVSSTSPSRRRHREADVWQRRFFDHLVRDDDDHAIRLDYLHYNPVKHGYVACPKDWPHSSFPHWVEQGAYPLDWGCPNQGPAPDFSTIEDLTGE